MATTVEAPQKTLVERLEECAVMLSVNDVAALFGEHPDTIYRRTKQKTIPHMKLGKALRFDPQELARWLKDNHIG